MTDLAHGIFNCDENGVPTDQIAYVTPAEDADVVSVLSLPNTEQDTRSGWLWLRLADGTLMLGVFPQGNTYELVSELAPFNHEEPPK